MTSDSDVGRGQPPGPLDAGALFALGLPGSARAAELPVGPAWSELLAAAGDDRAVPILANAARLGLVRALPMHHEALDAAHEAMMRSCLVLERATIDTAGLFDRAGVEFRVLKGPASAHLDYPDPSWRAFGDVDLLVRSSSYDQAVATLEGVGAYRRSPEVRPGFDRRFGKGVCMILPDGVQVDVHRTLASGPFGLTVDLDALFEGDDVLSIGGHALPVLTREHRFIHACYHAALGDATPRLVALRDIAQLLLTTELDVDRARVTAHAWRSRAVLAHAVAAAWARFGLEPTRVSRWAETYVGSGFEQRALAAYLGPGRSYARQMIAGVPAVPGLSAKVAYVWALVMVDASYAERHDGGRRWRIRRAWAARNTRARVN